MTAPTAARGGAATALVFVVAGMACQEVGASIAVVLFPHTTPLGMVMLRLVFSAIVLMAIARPSLRGHGRSKWLAVIGFGATLALMNGLFYLALSRLPLGVTVTIEVLGPLVLSIVASRRASAWIWALVAFAGVAALGGGGWDRLDPFGVVFALGAAASWALYILASARVGRAFPRLDGLALAMSAGALLSLPFGVVSGGAGLMRPEVIGLGALVAVLSSTIPYALELVALRRLAASAFAILMSLSPATASIAGLLILHQQLTVLEVGGIALVIVASIGAVRAAARAEVAARAEDAEPEEPFAEPVA